MSKIFKKINKCRISNDKRLINVGKIGPLTLTGTFLKNKNDKIPITPLDIVFSKKSNLLQLKHNYNQKKLFGDNYGYRSSLNNTMKKHLEAKSKILSKKINLKKGDAILDIGSNDGTFLNSFSAKLNRIGIDPTARKFRKYYDQNIKIIPSLFNSKVLKSSNIKFKLISSIAMFYDLQDPKLFCHNVSKHLHKDGIFHIEIAYLPDILKEFSFDTFCQEHLTYFSYKSFKYMIDQTPFEIIDYKRNGINGGSINFDLGFKNSKWKINKKNINKLVQNEKKLQIDNVNTYKKFFKKIKRNSIKINLLLRKLSKKNKKIFAFGASTKGNVILQMCKLDNKIIKGVYDINPFKFGKYTPGNKIPIKNENEIFYDKPDYIILLIWHFKKTLKIKFKKFNKLKINFIWPFPKLKIIKSLSDE
jgi:hypothetical protein